MRCDGGFLVLEDLIIGGNSGGGMVGDNVLEGISSKEEECGAEEMSNSVGGVDEDFEGKILPMSDFRVDIW